MLYRKLCSTTTRNIATLFFIALPSALLSTDACQLRIGAAHRHAPTDSRHAPTVPCAHLASAVPLPLLLPRPMRNT